MIKCVVPIICAKFAFHRQPIFWADLRGCWNGGELASLLTKALSEWLNFAFSEAKWWTMKVSGPASLEYQWDYPHSPAFCASLDHVSLYICVWFMYVMISRSAGRFGWWFCYWLQIFPSLADMELIWLVFLCLEGGWGKWIPSHQLCLWDDVGLMFYDGGATVAEVCCHTSEKSEVLNMSAWLFKEDIKQDESVMLPCCVYICNDCTLMCLSLAEYVFYN